jgi:L-iditol 2-dehydrogenase
MRAVRKLAPGHGHVALADTPEPVAGPGEVVVEVDAAGICGTDLHIEQGEFPTTPPVTMGHELAGRIAAVGPGVTRWRPGDRVTAETYFHTCGRCLHCRRGRPNLCRERRSIGSKADGAFAPFILLPAANLHRVPDGLALEHAALTEPLACVVHGVIDTAQVRAGDRVVVAGPGPIGLLALQVALAAGARVVVLGAAADGARLRTATRLGAAAALDVEATADLEAAVDDALGAEGADLVIECSGAGPAADTLLRLAARGGRYCQMGLSGRPVSLDLDLVCYKELVVTGSNATVPTAWPRALRLLADGRVDVSGVITHRFPLGGWDEALDTVQRRVGIKVLLRPGDEARGAAPRGAA